MRCSVGVPEHVRCGERIETWRRKNSENGPREEPHAHRAPEPGAFPGFGLHDELRLLVEAGLTPLQVLQSATLNPARFLGRTDDLGTVEAGKLADLVLLDANPLEDIGNTRRIRAVVVDGRLLERPALTPGQAYFRLAAWRTECILAP